MVHGGCQVVRHVWVSTKGGKEPRPLNPDVVVGAANVGSVRRLRNMVHGAVAMQRVSQHGPAQKLPDATQLQRQYSKAHKAQAASIEKSRGYRYCPAHPPPLQLDVAWHAKPLHGPFMRAVPVLCQYFQLPECGVRANAPCSHGWTVITSSHPGWDWHAQGNSPCGRALWHQVPGASLRGLRQKAGRNRNCVLAACQDHHQMAVQQGPPQSASQITSPAP